MELEKHMKIAIKEIEGHAKRIHEQFDEYGTSKDINKLEYVEVHCDIVIRRARWLLKQFREIKEAPGGQESEEKEADTK